MPFCRHCGGQLTDDARFCSHCGESLATDASEPESAGGYETYDWAADTPTKHPVVSQNERTTALFCHLSTFAGFIFPFGNIIAPLVIWLMRRLDSPYIDHHGKEAVNFQISVTIYVVISAILILLIIGIPMLIAVGFFSVVTTLIATVRASNGIEYRYPLAIRLVK